MHAKSAWHIYGHDAGTGTDKDTGGRWLFQLCTTRTCTVMLRSARLVAPKPDGSPWPLGIGEAMYRASERCMLIMTGKGRIDKALLPGQFGVGVGVEPQIHFVRSVASRFRFVKVDFGIRNAFNEVDSAVIINEVRADFPELDPFATWAYGSPARLLRMCRTTRWR